MSITEAPKLPLNHPPADRLIDSYWSPSQDPLPSARDLEELRHVKSDLGRGYGGRLKVIAGRALEVPGVIYDDSPTLIKRYNTEDFADAAESYRAATDDEGRERAVAVLIARIKEGTGIQLDGDTFDAVRKEAKKDLQWAAKLKQREGEPDPLDVLVKDINDYHDVEERLYQAETAYKKNPAAYRIATKAYQVAKGAAAGYGLGSALPWVASHISSRVLSRQEAVDPRATARMRTLARLALFGATVINVGWRMKTGADADGGVIDQALGYVDDAHGLPTDAIEKSLSTSAIAHEAMDALNADNNHTGGGKDTGEFVAGVSNDDEEAVKKVLAGEHAEDTGQGQTVSPPNKANHEGAMADKTVELGEYKKDKETGLYKGTVWYHVDQYAREQGIRDQLNKDEYSRFMDKAVDQVLKDNTIGGADASMAERRDVAADLDSDKRIKLSGSIFEDALPDTAVDAQGWQGTPETPLNRDVSVGEGYRDETKDTLDQEYPNPSLVQDELDQKYPAVSSEVDPIVGEATETSVPTPNVQAEDGNWLVDAGKTIVRIGGAGAVATAAIGAAKSRDWFDLQHSAQAKVDEALEGKDLFTVRDEAAARVFLREKWPDREAEIFRMDRDRVIAEANKLKLSEA